MALAGAEGVPESPEVARMATATSMTCVEQIGETAGEVWRLLEAQGPLSLAKLAKEIDAQRDVVMQAVGWLAREDKVRIEEDGRARIVYLQ
jgi:hypothetical protein